MTELRETIAVPAPASATQENILRYFESRRTVDGSATIPLHVSLRDFGLPDALALERDVAVTVSKLRDAETFNEDIFIKWTPVDAGPYPTFTGRLLIWSEDDPQESFIQLDGMYQPPLGAFGQVFDAAIGYLIAQFTARAFLRDLKDAAITFAGPSERRISR